MKRRIFSIGFVISFLMMLLALSLTNIHVSALTPTVTATPCGSSLTITGRVYSTTQQNIAGATIVANTSVSHPFATTSAADGTYSLNIPATSDYACKVTGMSVTAAGYLGNNRTISSSQLFLQPVQNFGMLSLATVTPVSTSNDLPWPDLTVSSVTYLGSSPACANSPKVQVVVANIGAFPANSSFSVSLTGALSQTVNGLAAGQSVTLIFSASGTTATVDSTNVITETNESNNSLTGTFGLPTQAHTCTPSGPTLTPTRTPTFVITNTSTRTPTPVTGACSPVTSSITAPFTFDGAGTFCWQSSNLGAYINSWNTTSVTLNGVNVTNLYVASGSYPAKIGGFWYVGYNSAVAWGHFEVK